MKLFIHIGLVVFTLSLFSCWEEEPHLTTWYISHEEPLNYEKKVDGWVQIHGDFLDIREPIKVEMRGGWSRQFDKKSYSVNTKKNIKIDSFDVDDDFILNANYIDKTFLRHFFSYKVYNQFVGGNKRLAPQSSFSEVYVNDEYQGLYAIHPRIDKSYLNLDDKKSGSFIFKDPSVFRKEIPSEFTQSGNTHDQNFPDLDDLDYNPLLDSVRQLLLDHQGCDLTSIKNIFDLQELAKWQLMLELSHNSDGLLKNFYLFRQNDKDKWHICIWDYDHSYGRDGDNELNNDREILDVTRNVLLAKLNPCPEYQDLLKENWTALRHSRIVSMKHFSDMIKDHVDKREPFIRRNFEKWPANSQDYFDGNALYDEIIIMREYLINKIPQLDKKYGFTP